MILPVTFRGKRLSGFLVHCFFFFGVLVLHDDDPTLSDVLLRRGRARFSSVQATSSTPTGGVYVYMRGRHLVGVLLLLHMYQFFYSLSSNYY